MRVLLTGGTGFIGSHLLPTLAAEHEVVALARRRPPDTPEGVTWIERDLAAPFDASDLPARVDAVIHLAQSRQYRDFPAGADDVFAVNVEGTFRLLDYARRAGAQRFVYASTGGVYGASYERLVETAQVDPLNFYLASKYAAETLMSAYRGLLHTIVFRFFFVYGPGQQGMLVPSLLGRVVRDEEIAVLGRPGLRINPIHVADAIRVFGPALALERSDLFNVAGDKAVRIEELVAAMGRAAGRTPRVRHEEGRPEGDLVGDNERMKAVLGVTPAVTLEQGLASMLD